jgi:hypothetical protein
MSELPGLSASGLGATASFDRRATVRYVIKSESADARLIDGQGPPCAVRVQNLSAKGLAFLADRRIEPHTLLSVELPSKDEFGSRRLVMRVRAAAALSAGVWMIGCEFSRPLSSLELLALL